MKALFSAKCGGRLLRNPRKTEPAPRCPGLFCGARRALCAFQEPAQNGARRQGVLACFVVRAAPFALFRNPRKTERGAKVSWPVLWCAPRPLRFSGTRAKRSAAPRCPGLFCGARRALCASGARPGGDLPLAPARSARLGARAANVPPTRASRPAARPHNAAPHRDERTFRDSPRCDPSVHY